MATLCVFRSSSVDTPPLETIASSEALPKDVDIKNGTTVIEEKVEESPAPTVTQPPHTTPDLSFASEVT